jgi:hypothetical protein
MSDFWRAVLAGIGGTIVMTAFMYLVNLFSNKRLKVVDILGTMLTGKTRAGGTLSYSPKAIVTGLVAHFTVGIVFALAYLGLWLLGVGGPYLLSSIIFGAVSGVVAVFVWRTFFFVHSRPPAIEINAYLVAIFFAHIVFAVEVVVCYRMLAGL